MLFEYCFDGVLNAVWSAVWSAVINAVWSAVWSGCIQPAEQYKTPPFVCLDPTLSVHFFTHLTLRQMALAGIVRAVLALAMYTSIFTTERGLSGSQSHLVYTVTCKLLLCVVLFHTASLCKILLARMMAAHFHKSAFFEKMHDALRKVGECLQKNGYTYKQGSVMFSIPPAPGHTPHKDTHPGVHPHGPISAPPHGWL